MTKEEHAKVLAALEESEGLVEAEWDTYRSLYGRYPPRQKRIEGLKAIYDAHVEAIAIMRREPQGLVSVPSKPTREMLNAAVDVDSFKLGDISPLGFRISPQMLFEKCYLAMLDAAPKTWEQPEPISDAEIERIIDAMPAYSGRYEVACVRAVLEKAR